MAHTSVHFDTIAGQEGDDEIYVLSTNPSLMVSLYGALGSDTFIITPSNIDPVISQNLRGHRGILEHEVISTDPDYTGLKVRGVQCDVLDNDGNYSYVSVVDQEGFHLMSEDGDGEFSFFVYPTVPPEDDVIVNIVAPAALDENRYVLINGLDADILNFTAGDFTPQEVTVRYNDAVQKLDITDKNLLIKIDVDVIANRTTTKDERFANAEQSLLPVDIKLMPSVNNTLAKSVTVWESTNGTAVLEGGFGATYDVYLRPCSQELLSDIKVTMSESVPGQILLSPSVLTGADFDNETCEATVHISAVDDDDSEGDHYVNIQVRLFCYLAPSPC